MTEALAVAGRVPPRLAAVRRTGCRGSSAARTSARTGSGNVGASNVFRVYGRAARGRRRAARRREGLRGSVARALAGGALVGVLAGGGRDGRPRAADLPPLREGREDGRDRGRRDLRARPARGAHLHRRLARRLLLTRYASLASIATAVALVVLVVALGYPWPIVAFGDRRRRGRHRRCTARTSAGSSPATSTASSCGALGGLTSLVRAYAARDPEAAARSRRSSRSCLRPRALRTDQACSSPRARRRASSGAGSASPVVELAAQLADRARSARRRRRARGSSRS